MITAERKPLDEILALVGDKKKVLVAGCDTCVAICLTGGEKEAEILASELRIKAEQDGREVAVEHTAAIRQCEWEYLDMIADKVGEADIVAQHGLRHRHPEHGREVRAQARRAGREHQHAGHAAGARRLARALRRLRRVRHRRDRRHLPRRALQQEPHERPLRRLARRPLRGHDAREGRDRLRLGTSSGSASRRRVAKR